MTGYYIKDGTRHFIWMTEFFSLPHLKLITHGWKEEFSVFEDGTIWVMMVSP